MVGDIKVFFASSISISLNIYDAILSGEVNIFLTVIISLLTIVYLIVKIVKGVKGVDKPSEDEEEKSN